MKHSHDTQNLMPLKRILCMDLYWVYLIDEHKYLMITYFFRSIDRSISDPFLKSTQSQLTIIGISSKDPKSEPHGFGSRERAKAQKRKAKEKREREMGEEVEQIQRARECEREGTE